MDANPVAGERQEDIRVKLSVCIVLYLSIYFNFPVDELPQNCTIPYVVDLIGVRLALKPVKKQFNDIPISEHRLQPRNDWNISEPVARLPPLIILRLTTQQAFGE